MKPVANELLYGYITHYTIGVGFAVIYMLGWDLLVGGPASPVWALVYGFATTVASLFFVYPSVGLGVFGRAVSPKALKLLSPPWPTTCSSRSGYGGRGCTLREHRGKAERAGLVVCHLTGAFRQTKPLVTNRMPP